jgi:hypothetical protein
MIDTGFLLALAGAVLGAASMVLHVVAPRTKNVIDDQLRDDIDEVLAFIRGQQPPATTTVSTTASAPSSSAKAGAVATVALLAVAIGGASLAPACHAVSPAIATGVVAAFDCEAAGFKPDDLSDATQLADATVEQWLAGGATASTTAIKADLAPFRSDLSKCALAGALALATAALAPPSSSSTPGTAAQRLSPAAAIAPPPDPAQVRAAFSMAARELGWAPVRAAGGQVL